MHHDRLQDVLQLVEPQLVGCGQVQWQQECAGAFGTWARSFFHAHDSTVENIVIPERRLWAVGPARALYEKSASIPAQALAHARKIKPKKSEYSLFCSAFLRCFVSPSNSPGAFEVAFFVHRKHTNHVAS